MKKLFLMICLVAVTFMVVAGGAFAQPKGKDVKIGFIVKDPQEPWFLDEWKFADQAAKEKGFTLVKIGAKDGEQLITAIDNLGAQQAQGFIVCVPDVKLGPAVVAKARANNLKLMTVDDRLVDNKGKAIEAVPHMGISAFNIGKLVGASIAGEIKNRKWDFKDVYAIKISFNELPTAKDRTDGAEEALLQGGFLKGNIIDAPQKYGTEGAFDAANIVISKNPTVKKWVLFGLNDEAVIGGVRALEGNGFAAADVIGVGIGGSESGINEFKKQQANGFFGTVIISPKRHGYETALNMYDWISGGKNPPALVLTTGELATRKNYAQVQKSLGLI